MSYMSRPSTAPAASYRAKFDTTGCLARPAGVAGLFAASGSTAGSFAYGLPLDKATGLTEHALRRHSPYAMVTPTGWMPREPQVRPTAAVTGAGVVSAGSIDNTYVPAPLMNAWGKARELATKEIFKPPHKQATDLLIVAKGGRMPAPAQTEADMETVRGKYSRTIPIFHGLDPQRCDSGFVRGPNIIPGAMPPPVSPYNPNAEYKQIPADHALRKLHYDQTFMKGSRIPVARVVRASPIMPPSPQARFLATSAGLPGGLSLQMPTRPTTAA